MLTYMVTWCSGWLIGSVCRRRATATFVSPCNCDLVVDRCMVTWLSGRLTQWLGVPADQSDGHICTTICMWPCCWQVYGYLAFWSTGSVCRPEWRPHLYHRLYVTLLLAGVWLPGLLVDGLGVPANPEWIRQQHHHQALPAAVCQLLLLHCLHRLLQGQVRALCQDLG